MLTKPLTSPSPTALEIAEHMPLVHQVVARVLRRVPPSVVRDDLVAAGVLGLVDCLRRHNGAEGSFEAYARIRIHGAVIDELRKQDFVPRHRRARDAGLSVVWLEDLAPNEDGVDIADGAAVDAAAFLEGCDDARAIAAAVAALPEREATIIRMRYFESKSVREIATQLALSDPRVSQLHARALTRLRETIAAALA